MDKERLDAILYLISGIVALVTVRRIMRKSKQPDVAVKLKATEAEIKRRLAMLEAMIEQAPDP